MSSEDQIKREETGGVSQQENAYGSSSKKRTCARHCKRFWWIYLIVLSIIILLVVLLVIFVGIPAMAQSKLNQATLTVEGIHVTNTQTDSFTMSINSTIHSNSSVSATFDAFIGDMYLEDLEPHTPFAQINFPETQSGSLVPVNISQNVAINNLDALTTFNTWLLNNQSLRVTVNGNTNVHVSGIGKGFGVNFKKTVTLVGMNMFNGLAVPQSNISLKTFDSEGDNFIGFSTIPNPSVVAFEIGTAVFDNNLFGQTIGNLTIDNFSIYPGINNVSVRAIIDQTPVLSAVTRTPYCSDGNLLFSLIGKSVVNNGQPLPYFATALATLNSSVSIPVGTDLAADGVPIKCPSS
jgi:hypothetical protein